MLLLPSLYSVNQKILKQMFVRVGVAASRILVADNGEKGVEAVHACVARSNESGSSLTLLVMMDVLMPVLDGLQATKAIRASSAIPPAYQPYIIALTANAMQGDEQMCIDAGMNSYLSKVRNKPTDNSIIRQNNLQLRHCPPHLRRSVTVLAILATNQCLCILCCELSR